MGGGGDVLGVRRAAGADLFYELAEQSCEMEGSLRRVAGAERFFKLVDGVPGIA